MNNMNYHDKKNAENMVKLREIMTTLPHFCREFFLGIKDTTSTRTRLAYAYDLGIFFEYLHENHPVFKKCDITEFELKWLDEVTSLDITEYLDYLSYYTKDNDAITNDERGKQRKLASLRSFYKFFFNHELIQKNPAALVSMPKLHKKEIIRLDSDEVEDLLAILLLPNFFSGDLANPESIALGEHLGGPDHFVRNGLRNKNPILQPVVHFLESQGFEMGGVIGIIVFEGERGDIIEAFHHAALVIKVRKTQRTHDGSHTLLLAEGYHGLQ